jgi:hypothetical protein
VQPSLGRVRRQEAENGRLEFRQRSEDGDAPRKLRYDSDHNVTDGGVDERREDDGDDDGRGNDVFRQMTVPLPEMVPIMTTATAATTIVQRSHGDDREGQKR